MTDTETIESLMGTDTDKAVARRLGVTEYAVKSRRQAARVPGFLPQAKVDWSKADKLLGTASDAVIARYLGVNQTSVRARRIRLQIPAFKP